jgi:dolichol-phosphate mannosyltransferase
MKEQKTISSNLTFVLIFSLIALAVLQTFKLELWNDEAYYWVFSQNLDWGYLDHPPMTALLIKLGTLMFGKNEFGVRFFFIVSFLGSIFTIYKLCNKKINTTYMKVHFIIYIII